MTESATSSAEPPATSPTLPDKAELEREQIYLANQKTKIELRKLEQDAKPEPWWLKLVKNVVAIGGILTVAATAYGIWDSYNKTIDDRDKARVDRELTRAADQRTRFEDAIKRLESPSTISKLVGVSVLSGYLTTDNSAPANRDVHRQILFTLAGLMATEHDYQTQVAVTDLIRAIPENGPIEKADWIYFQEILISQSRALVGKGDLLNRRHIQPGSTLSDDEKAARTVGNLIAISARKGAIPTDLKFRDVYCVECDFHGVTFPSRVDFTGAILDRANFSGAILKEAIFDNAELIGTTFVEADLPGARFRSLETMVPISDDPKRNDSPLGRTRYLDHAVAELNENAIIQIKMPNFSCANLTNANFDGHALFPGVLEFRRQYAKKNSNKPGWYGTIPSHLIEHLTRNPKIEFYPARVVPAKFLKANLTNAKLDKARYFILAGRDDHSSYMSSYHTIGEGEPTLGIGAIAEEAFQIAPDSEEEGLERQAKADVNTFQKRLRASFYEAKLDGATLPPHVSEFFKKQTPRTGDYRWVFRRFPGTTDPELACTMRSR